MIKRYFSDENFIRMQKHFSFLIRKINDSLGELELSIRDDYFNIYYKGNSLSKVSFKEDDKYQIDINSKFFEGTSVAKSKNDGSCSKNKKGDYYSIMLSSKQLPSFFKEKHLKEFISKIKKENYKEEITFEQALIADNKNRESFFFIDRQVSDGKMKRKTLDLLALKQKQGNKYHFVICEVKLGNNPELKDKVVDQLNYYVTHINEKENFNNYKDCYEKQYKQKRTLGLINIPAFPSIEIEKPVEGRIIVGGYSGIAKSQLDSLQNKCQNLKIEHFTYELKP